MLRKFERPLFFLGFGAALSCLLLFVYQQEKILADGEVVVLELAPVDPRSLMMGDYMTIAYAALQSFPADAIHDRGFALLEKDGEGLARIRSLHESRPEVAAGQGLLAVRRRGSGLRISAEKFFFQEGQADLFQQARFGELRVDQKGQALLVRLLDEGRKPLGSNKSLL